MIANGAEAAFAEKWGGDVPKNNSPNWKKIKAEYIRGGISQQKLADKYGVPYGTLHRRVMQEGWSAKRKECESKIDQKLTEKIADAQATKMAQMAELYDDFGLVTMGTLLEQMKAFPKSGGATRLVRETVKKQEIMIDGKKVEIPLKSLVVSDLSELVKNAATLGKSYGLDAASKRQQEKQQETEDSEPFEDDGFIAAVTGARPDEWDLADEPLNIEDSGSDDESGDGDE